MKFDDGDLAFYRGKGHLRAKDAAGPSPSAEHRDGRADESDAGDMCVREFAVRAVSDAAPNTPGECWIDVIASTDAIDSYGEIVEQTWDLSRFNANPVVLWAHQSRELTLGYASNIGVVDGKLQMRLNFCTAEANPKGPQVYAGFKQKSQRAVSVGFYPLDIRMEMRDGKEVYILSNNLLLEVSPTPIGANPEALAKAHARVRSLAKALPHKSNESPAAERGIATENDMDPKDKAALDAANSARETAEKNLKAAEEKATAAEKAHADTRAALAKALTFAVERGVEAGRFAKDEIAEQVELATNNFGLFERMAAKREIRGAGIVGAPKLPGSPAGGSERAAGDGADNGDDLAALAQMNG
jgi:HK97 family phage prohead protease